MHQPASQAARHRLDIAPSRFVVLCVCSTVASTVRPIAPREGIDTVILACAMLHQCHGVDAMLIVIVAEHGVGSAGCGPAEDLELARLRQLAHALDLAPHMRVVVRPPPVVLDDYHAGADVFASTPWRPSTAAAIAVTKAMACSLPVVGATGGIMDAVTDNATDSAIAALVHDGVTGYLVPPRDPVVLCQRLARLQRQPLLARSMGVAGRAKLFATAHRKTAA